MLIDPRSASAPPNAITATSPSCGSADMLGAKRALILAARNLCA